jgi:hypothetical protein
MMEMLHQSTVMGVPPTANYTHKFVGVCDHDDETVDSQHRRCTTCIDLSLSLSLSRAGECFREKEGH